MSSVVLIPTDPTRVGDSTYYKTVTTDQAGNFTANGVIPGAYKVYAWSDLEPGAHLDPDFVRPFESKG